MKYPIVSYAGEYSLFSTIQSSLISELPQGDVEWKRSYGRFKTRNVNVEVDFVPFSEEKLGKNQTPKILDHPIFHTFWTDCPDVDTYKSSVREKLQAWVQILKQHEVSDWMIVIVETPDTKKGNKLLPRTTVLDKLKNDFGGKQSERCLSLIDPAKNDSRASESWQIMLSKLRQLIMIAYNRVLNRFEDLMRSERERRIEKNWSFCEYFLLQEELAQVFSLLSLQEEALVQYDELDALFTQFVLNSAAGDTPNWLENFSHPCENWEGFHLNSFQHSPMQEKIKEKNLSLLEFRNYLFQQQCQILMHLKKPWELASRALMFLQNTISELRILDVSVYGGGIACWGFLSCLEVIRLLYMYKDAVNTDSHAVHTAPLWAYSRDKLKELGVLCGLMPGGKATSAQLHIVINLVYGMGEDPHVDDPVLETTDEHNKMSSSPMTRLKEALSSPEAFTKHFLDISELAISTYKHIGRIRSARHIGKDLAQFYMCNGAPHKAVPFLIDQLKTFLDEDWPQLTVDTHVHLAKCYLATDDTERYIKTCVLLAASQIPASLDIRNKYFQDVTDAIHKISDERTVGISTDKVFEIGWLKVVSTEPIIIGALVDIEIMVESRLPNVLELSALEVQLRHTEERVEKSPNVKSKRFSDIERRGSTSSSNSQSNIRKLSVPNSPIRSVSDMSDLNAQLKNLNKNTCEEEDNENWNEKNLYKKQLRMEFKIDRQQDTSIGSASVSCVNPHKILRRRDSHGGLENFEKSVVKETFTDFLSAKNVTLKPGKNHIIVSTKISKNGSFSSGQIVLSMDKLEFICSRMSTRGSALQLDVTHESPRAYLSRRDAELLAGIPQVLVLTLNSGSTQIEKDTVVTVKASRGLKFKAIREEEEGNDWNMEDFSQELIVLLPSVRAFSKTTVELLSFADLKPQKDSTMTEHSVTISSAILPEASTKVDVHFVLPLSASYKLHTSQLKKFIQVSICGLVPQKLYLTKPQLKISETKDHCPVKLLNNPDQILVASKGYDVNYLWELEVDYDIKELPNLKATFTIDYDSRQENLGKNNETYQYCFDVINYKSLYILRTRVDPMKGTEFCRAANISHLNINLEQVNSAHESPTCESIMYEVIADQTMWAVCGQSSGVVTMETGPKQNVMTEVMPLISGFLPLPSVRLSKYIPAETKPNTKENRKLEMSNHPSNMRRLEPFSAGQIYNLSRALQVHVLPAVNAGLTDPAVG